MDRNLIIKSILILPSLWFIAYIIMIIIGMVGQQAGCENSFYCGFYCHIGIAIFTIATVGFIAYFIRCCLKQ